MSDKEITLKPNIAVHYFRLFIDNERHFKMNINIERRQGNRCLTYTLFVPYLYHKILNDCISV